MRFIRLGSRYVNLALVTDVFVQDDPDATGPHADVYLAAPMGERSHSDGPVEVRTRHVHVTGAEAAFLLRVLDDHLVGDPRG